MAFGPLFLYLATMDKKLEQKLNGWVCEGQLDFLDLPEPLQEILEDDEPDLGVWTQEEVDRINARAKERWESLKDLID